MTDIILGMGEVGATLFSLLEQRGYSCIGVDTDASRCKNYSVNDKIKDPQYLHICLPGELDEFTNTVTNWIDKIPRLQAVLIHSTVRPGTTHDIQKDTGIPVLYSPVRGVHARFLKDMKRYTKFISSDDLQVDSQIKTDLEKRFQKIDWMSTTKTAELAKILVDTTYYGWLINYAQITKMICKQEGVNFDEMWKFADEINENLGNRPKMYPGVIGGHCVIPNLKLMDNENLDMVRKINELYEKFKI